jgi:hypothetical protein
MALAAFKTTPAPVAAAARHTHAAAVFTFAQKSIFSVPFTLTVRSLLAMIRLSSRQALVAPQRPAASYSFASLRRYRKSTR